jgi:gamma-glutamyl hydrolase
MKSYVDWFENRGITVVPIPYDTPNIDELFHMINGLFIPGGDMPYIMNNPQFISNITKIFEMSLGNNYFPIWGTCFGFEMLLFLVGGFTTLKKYDAHGFYPMQITEEGHSSRMMRSFSKEYKVYLEKKKSTRQNHAYGISIEDFMSNLHLRRFYTILATSVDDSGKEYVCAMEAKSFPIYGVQFHPERQKTTGAFADFFISELKKNKHTCVKLPSMSSYLSVHKCAEYRESKKVPCYSFSTF